MAENTNLSPCASRRRLSEVPFFLLLLNPAIQLDVSGQTDTPRKGSWGNGLPVHWVDRKVGLDFFEQRINLLLQPQF
jgi:hypothetical protein